MRRVLLIFLAALLLLSAVSCAQQKEETPATTPDTTAGGDPDPTTDDPGAPAIDLTTAIALNESKKSNYIIVRPAGSGDAVKDLAESIRAAVFYATGIRLPSVTDDSPAAQQSAGYEILVGETNRAESAEAYSALHYRDYSVSAVGNKIIIAGEAQYMLKPAVDAFLEGLVTQEGTLYATWFGTVAGKYPNGQLNVAGNPLSGYRIVYPQGDLLASDTAEQVRLLLRRQTGVELSRVSDAEAATDYEILVGKTNRAESGAVHAELGEREIALQISGAKALLAWKDPLLAESLLRQLSSKLLVIEKAERQDFSEMTFQTAIPSGLPSELTQIGVMSFNVLGVGSNSASCYNRDDLAAAVIRTYQPDIVGLQEFDARWRLEPTNLFALLGSPYEEAVCAEALPDRNWNPILYRTDRLELLACGNQPFTQGKEWPLASTYPSDSKTTHHRAVTWAVFRVRETGETVIALNMHIHIDSSDTAEQKRAIQTSEAQELIAKAQELQTSYPNSTVFVTGDYNSNITGPVIGEMLKNGYSDTYALAANKTDVCGFHAAPVFNAEKNLYDSAGRAFSGNYQTAIDHCLTIGNPVTVSDYLYVTLSDAFLISDHNPLYVRVGLGVPYEGIPDSDPFSQPLTAETSGTGIALAWKDIPDVEPFAQPLSPEASGAGISVSWKK